jgi:hypothetical protein
VSWSPAAGRDVRRHGDIYGMAKPNAAVRARRTEKKRKRREARKVVTSARTADRDVNPFAPSLADVAGFQQMFLRRPVPCVFDGCAGSMTFVEGSDRQPTEEEKEKYPWAATMFERVCGICGQRSPASQGAPDFG